MRTLVALLLFFSSMEALEQKSLYAHPGIVIRQGGGYVGSDHLLNLASPIAIAVEILKPDGTTLPFTEEEIKKMIEKRFKEKQLFEDDKDSSSEDYRPIFEMLLVVYPIDQGFVALCDGRLFESVDPKRVKLEKDTYFQAITWEKQTLIVAPKDDFASLSMKTISEIVDSFVERVQYFVEIKRKLS